MMVSRSYKSPRYLLFKLLFLQNFLDPIMLFSALFSKGTEMCSFFGFKDQVLHIAKK